AARRHRLGQRVDGTGTLPGRRGNRRLPAAADLGGPRPRCLRHGGGSGASGDPDRAGCSWCDLASRGRAGMSIALVFALLLMLLALGAPVTFALGIAGTIGIVTELGWD